MSSSINLAILSPNDNLYSETFIQAHKQLPFNVSYYFNGFVPAWLADKGKLNKSVAGKAFHKLKEISGVEKATFNERNLAKSLKENKINCVLAEYGLTGAESLKVIKQLNIPLIVHFHGYDASMHEVIEKYRQKYSSMFNYADAIVVVSTKMFNDLAALGCPPGKMHLIPYGPSPSFFDVKPAYNSNQFIAIGRFVDKKAPYLTLAAFKEVVENYPDAQLLMGGTGPLLETCVNLANVWGISKNVSFKGALSPAEVVSAFQNSIAFVQHSIIANNGDSEGSPVAVLEASAAGLAVIATRHAGIAETVIDGQTGLLVNELDVKAMARHMLAVLNNKSLAKSLGEKAKEHIKTNFSLQHHLAGITALVNQAVAYK